MLKLAYRDVNEAFYDLVRIFARYKRIPEGDNTLIEGSSRNGPVLYLEDPVAITYEIPQQRVLLNHARDANPFFHLYEALWMLSGRNDVKPLEFFVKRMGEYSDDGETLNGAYGYRWRNALLRGDKDEQGTVDQLGILAAHLSSNPDSRRAVLSMWNVEDDLLKIGGYGNRTICDECKGTGAPVNYEFAGRCPKCGGTAFMEEPASKDVCCNLSVMFSLRRVFSHGYRLDMTVVNRSNDLIWGLLGANYVHFTFLQEYLASRIKIPRDPKNLSKGYAEVALGRYNHFTSNLHVYKSNWEPDKWLAPQKSGEWNPWVYRGNTIPLVEKGLDTVSELDKEIRRVVSDYASPSNFPIDPLIHFPYKGEFLSKVAAPMFKAFTFHKAGFTDVALALVEDVVKDNAWREAGAEWLRKRLKTKKD